MTINEAYQIQRPRPGVRGDEPTDLSPPRFPSHIFSPHTHPAGQKVETHLQPACLHTAGSQLSSQPASGSGDLPGRLCVFEAPAKRIPATCQPAGSALEQGRSYRGHGHTVDENADSGSKGLRRGLGVCITSKLLGEAM